MSTFGNPKTSNIEREGTQSPGCMSTFGAVAPGGADNRTNTREISSSSEGAQGVERLWRPPEGAHDVSIFENLESPAEGAHADGRGRDLSLLPLFRQRPPVPALLASLESITSAPDLDAWLLDLNASRCRPGLTSDEAKTLRRAYLARRRTLRRSKP